jgi:hypothetical protein
MSSKIEPGRIPYQTLDPRKQEIRVISINPAPAEDPDADESDSTGRALAPLSISLRTVSLDDPSLRYFALSYVWGNAGDTVPITVDGFHFDATRNLVEALRVIRKTFGEDPRMYLWVDAVSPLVFPERLPIALLSVEICIADGIRLRCGHSGMHQSTGRAREERAGRNDGPHLFADVQSLRLARPRA